MVKREISKRRNVCKQEIIKFVHGKAGILDRRIVDSSEKQNYQDE